MDRFLGFTDSIVNQTKNNFAKLGTEANAQDALVMTTVDLFSSRSIQGNVMLRNSMQKEAGPINTYSGRKSVDKLRENKRKRNTHKKNSRWYRNGLQKGSDEDKLVTPDRKIESIPQITADHKTRMKKNILKRLVDAHISAKNEKKTLIFKKLIAEDIESLTIVGLAVELENIVDESTDMRINMCS